LKYQFKFSNKKLFSNLDFVEILSPFKDQVLTEKDELKLSVEVSDPSVPGQWFKDGKPLEADKNIIIESYNGKHQLTIKNAKLDDAGVYTFVAQDAKCEAKITVNEEPLQIKKRLQDQDALENNQVVFECELNKPNQNVEWFFNDIPIHQALEPNSYVISQIDAKYVLTIPKCQLKNQGNFSIAIPNTNVKSKALLSIDEAPAEFISNLEDKTVKEDETAEFICEVSKADAKVKWSLNNERLVAGENIKITTDGNKRILKMKKCQLNDSGDVACTLSGERSTKAKLIVEEVPIEIKLDSIEVYEKEDAKFEAKLSKPINKRDVSWSFGELKISESLKFNFEGDRDQTTYKLIIHECSLNDSGDYTINVRNDHLTVKLLVKELPCKFAKPLRDQNTTEHNNVSFEIALTKPNHKVKWFLNGQELIPNERIMPKQLDDVRFSLNINDVQLGDAGKIKCIVYNDKDEEVAESEANLSVNGIYHIFIYYFLQTLENLYKHKMFIEIPLSFEKGLGNIKCMEKDEIRFECKLNKEVKPEDISWYRDGVKLSDGEDDGRIQIITEGTKQILIVKNTNLDDSGNYDIRINSIKSTGSLKVKGLV
jgi:hypothetical protein